MQPPADVISLQAALAAARDNIEVRIASRGLAAAQADILAADHAPLPQLSAKLSQIDLQNGLGPGNVLTAKRIDKGVGLDWTWERGDKRALRTESARRSAAAAAADIEEVRLQQLVATHAAFFDLLAAQGRQQEMLAMEASARQTADIARARLKAGDVAVQDAARSEVEAERAGADVASAATDRRRAGQALALLIGRSAAADTLQASADWPASTDVQGGPPLDALAEARADVQAAAERVRAAGAALAGATAQRKNDVTWGASIDHYPGTSTRQVEVRLAMPLSWGYAYEGEIDRARALQAQAEDTLERTRRNAVGELLRLRTDLAGAAERATRLNEQIVPRSRAVADRAELAYRRGALPLTDLLDARRTLRAVELDALAARADLAKALGAWRLRTGQAP